MYPYTIIARNNIDFIYSFLRRLDFSFTGMLKDYYKQFDRVYCVVDDMRTFGNFCFYVRENQMDPTRIRKFVPNNQEFLCEVYKLVGYDES